MSHKLLKTTLGIALATTFSAMLLTGCSKGPNKPTLTSNKSAGPAELYLSSDDIDTKEQKKQVKSYDMTVKIDNTDESAAYINLHNEGDTPLSIKNINFLNNDDKLFALESACGTQVMPNSACKLKISFSGQYKGRYTSNITVETNSNGRYVGPLGKIHIIAEAQDRITGTIRAIPAKKDNKKPMANLRFVSSNLQQYAEIKNTGIDDATIEGFELIGEDKKYFTFTQECPKVLKVGQSCELKINYKQKWDKMALTYLVVKSNGVLFPSDTIRLVGEPKIDRYAPKMLQLAGNDNMNMKVTSVKTVQNTENFLEDYSNVKPIYYFRTMYQGDVNSQFKQDYENIIDYYFTRNNFKVTKDASKADKIVNIYPTISLLENGKGDMKVVAHIKANIVTKASIKQAINKTVIKNDVENQQETQSFKSTKQNEHEQIEFIMEIEANNYSDAFFVYNKASDKINSFMFNLLGLQEE